MGLMCVKEQRRKVFCQEMLHLTAGSETFHLITRVHKNLQELRQCFASMPIRAETESNSFLLLSHVNYSSLRAWFEVQVNSWHLSEASDSLGRPAWLLDSGIKDMTDFGPRDGSDITTLQITMQQTFMKTNMSTSN